MMIAVDTNKSSHVRLETMLQNKKKRLYIIEKYLNERFLPLRSTNERLIVLKTNAKLSTSFIVT